MEVESNLKHLGHSRRSNLFTKIFLIPQGHLCFGHSFTSNPSNSVTKSSNSVTRSSKNWIYRWAFTYRFLRHRSSIKSGSSISSFSSIDSSYLSLFLVYWVGLGLSGYLIETSSYSTYLYSVKMGSRRELVGMSMGYLIKSDLCGVFMGIWRSVTIY